MRATHNRNPITALERSIAKDQAPLMKLIHSLIKTDGSVTQLIARLTLGAVMFPHGAQLALGWFGGFGFTGTMGFFTGVLHIPAVFAFLAIAAQFAGALGLITGFLSRVAAFGIATTMVVAIATVHASVGFFMNWYGKQAGEGYEYHLLAIGLALIVMIGGAGKASVDAALAHHLESKS
jgi:putative oxidoreductase